MNLVGQYLKNLDEQIEQLKVISEQLKLIRQDLKELDEKEHQKELDDFIDKNHEKIYEAYCECYPEKINSDCMLEDLDYGELCEFVEDHLF